MRRILVAIDGSQQASKALSVAAELAAKLEGALRVVHTLPHFDGAAEPWFRPFAQAAEEDARRMVERSVAALALRPAEVTTVLLHGTAAEAISEEAQRWDAELVVIGSRGQGSVKRVLLGSVSDRLVHICERPVLVVR